ncbi:peptidylprolyl isomerase [Candidatus Pacearchaeota archaeon CG_4_9_14_0_2_um_filter_39_13]|nr:MAG: peptidylprolyl isomerase [Candidatus Pacearchaeota archaeon CG1_02_39_14]PJC45032.1 MAG: peptidylprolyl isomerase [Candidatus Pacearchaeota archaeon CG_4_9_14_0_2_um_filter_39_13]
MTEKQIRLETSEGDIVIALYSDMPVTAGNFEKLVSEGFYDNTKFHRIIEGFMIQGGDPLTKDDGKKNLWGTGGPGYKIKDEFGSKGNVRGTISMANAGPNTGGSQFFINLVDNNFLDGKHPVFGEVVEGMDVVDAIAKVDTNSQDRPLEDVIILKARIQ